ncbi:hypothetical protein [Arthrobacter sp. U41]|uniref:hypothetical protein n=1 Tax=Arthrobacter sp. U41 TaxID=1849032 RepID=UPI0012F7BAF8|nr:hypothetical protein [Arthrobacter sp. U41]
MPTSETVVHGIAVLDIHEDKWAIWQVSAMSLTGSLRASATNAVVTDGFDERAFRSLSYKRPVLLTSRARKHCTEAVVLETPEFDPEVFVSDCTSWVDLLQDLFWAENDRRASHNSHKVQARKKARAAGEPLPEYQRQGPLQDIDWPAPPLPSVWASSVECVEPVNTEALRVANGCIQLLNYWLEIENDRSRASRKYFNGVGGSAVRSWPVPATAVGAPSA